MNLANIVTWGVLGIAGIIGLKLFGGGILDDVGIDFPWSGSGGSQPVPAGGSGISAGARKISNEIWYLQLLNDMGAFTASAPLTWGLNILDLIGGPAKAEASTETETEPVYRIVDPLSYLLPAGGYLLHPWSGEEGINQAIFPER